MSTLIPQVNCQIGEGGQDILPSRSGLDPRWVKIFYTGSKRWQHIEVDEIVLIRKKNELEAVIKFKMGNEETFRHEQIQHNCKRLQMAAGA